MVLSLEQVVRKATQDSTSWRVNTLDVQGNCGPWRMVDIAVEFQIKTHFSADVLSSSLDVG